MKLRNARVFLFPVALVLAGLPMGCRQASGPDLSGEVARLQAELDTTREKLAAAEKQIPGAKPVPPAETGTPGSSAGVVDPLPRSTNPAPAANAPSEKDTQIAALQTEIANLKKRDAFVFAEASAQASKGVSSITLDRYQQFVRTFPDSPLVADANRAIAELTVATEREAKWRATQIDPSRPEREIVQRFNDGLASVEELAPLLKRRTLAEVLKILGPANTSYRNGSEIGYVDRIIDSTTGTKATLVIAFEGERVAALRVNYQGREIRP